MLKLPLTLRMRRVLEGLDCADRLYCDACGACVRGFEYFCGEEPVLGVQTCQFPCPEKDSGEHGAVESAGVRVSE